jgi:membrane protein YqaA with SNARE-associated domain
MPRNPKKEMSNYSPFGLFANPTAWVVVVVFSLVGLAFSLPTYYLGRKGMDYVREKFPNFSPERLDQLTGWHRRLGAFLLLLTALPLFGTVLPATAGATGTRLGSYLLWVMIVKLIRYWFLALILFGGYRVVTK